MNTGSKAHHVRNHTKEIAHISNQIYIYLAIHRTTDSTVQT